jgi:hypothetical protein
MDDAIVRLTTTAVGRLELKLAEENVDPDDLVMLSDYELVSLAGCTLERVPGKNNWVEQEGGLPEYICEVARSIHRGGKSISRSIAIAVSQVKKWAAGGGDVNADTRAKAAAALAQWEKMKASAKAK